MLRLTIKNLAANRIRLALTTFAVVLAVSFVVSSFVLTDGLRSSFGNLSSEIVAGTDLEVRPTDEFGGTDLVPTSALDDVRAIDGVAAAAPTLEIEDGVRPINAAGEEIPAGGPPQLAMAWIDDPRLSMVTLVEGDVPGAGEFTMDLDAAARHGFALGQTYDLVVPTGRTELTLSGLTSFGENNDTLGATLMHFDLATLRDISGIADGYDSIAVALGAEADRAATATLVEQAVPTAEVVDQATLESEIRSDFNAGINIIGNILLGFAGISLFVSIFIIYNTFSIVLGQRTRELALLRTVGADPAQLRRSVLAEALVIGVAASAIGIVTGIGVAFGLRGLFGLLGADLPASPVVLSTRTIVVAAVVGIVVTLVSAIGPARKASRVPPVAALRDGAAAGAVRGRTRLAIGGLLAAAGVAAGAAGLFAASTTASVIALLAAGSIGVFVGITLLSPVVAAPLTRLLGWPLARFFGTSGRLAGQNAGRNPQRTATTAAALMIGLALVSMTLTVGESAKAQLRSTLESSVTADFLAVDQTGGASPFPSQFTERIAALPETAEVTSFRYDGAEIGGDVRGIQGGDLAAVAELFDLGVTEGSLVSAGTEDPVLLSDEEATATGLGVGDTVAMRFSSGERRDLTVIGIFEDDIVADEPYLIDLATWNEVGAEPADTWVALALADGVDGAAAEQAFAALAADFPQVEISTANAYVAQVEAEVDRLLAAVNVMVALAVIIALIGIANTLALSVFERTRELGLLRAVGMSRGQLRRMVRMEAALVALFGAALGVAVGVGFGVAAVYALPSSITSTLAVPVDRIAVLVAVAGIAGLFAAWGPARRASRLNVLDAISG
ncbi:MAG: FtsX-like permease family protein [Actinomycetota bacterium]